VGDMVMKKIAVIGSINMDLVATVKRLPEPGETITGNSFGRFPGGKGANQAIAAGKLGGSVAMIGKLGNDTIAEEYLRVFQDSSVNIKGIGLEEEINSGIALIEVGDNGENRIIVVPGANGFVDRSFIDDKFSQIDGSDIILLQLEIPLDTVEYVLEKVKDQGKIIILDPAPAQKIKDKLYKYIDFITPNETEIKILTGKEVNCQEDLISAAEVLLNKGVKNVIAKAGSKGAFIINNQGIEAVKGFKVKTVDTTAAGDTFNGALAYALSNDNTVKESVIFACAAAAISTTGLGAQGAMPTVEQVRRILETNI
jgi:ribokinase